MASKKEQIIKELSPDFPNWTKDFQDFLIWQNYGIIEPETPDYGLWDAMEYLYANLMKSMIRISGIKDQWEGPEYLPLAVKAGLEVYFRSDRLECPFHFGTDELGFYLSTDLIYPEHIRKMDDNFWFLLVELTRHGVLDLWENRIFPDSHIREEPWFHRKTKSKVFHLIRNAVAWEKEEGIPDDLGMLIVRWKYDTSWEDLLEKGSKTFYNLYRINQSLWKKHR